MVRPLEQLWRLTPVGLVAGLTVVWAVTPSIPVKVRGSGLLTAPESRRAFYARGPGQVQDIKVAVGTAVAQGQLLLTLNRVGQPAEVGNVVSFLLSDEASYVNGAVLEVSGGMTV